MESNLELLIKSSNHQTLPQMVKQKPSRRINGCDKDYCLRDTNIIGEEK